MKQAHVAVSIGLVLASGRAFSQDKPPGWDNYQRGTQQENQRQQRESMRDKSNDPPRYQTSPNSSVGVDVQQKQLNYRKQFP
ncbi:hypothetical protein [Paraburkholderia caribensis]|uniref:hypothetical protein n=1 Tax=Paraburkholderia caribensis TaxID=75105 RepID=UPI000AA4D482|nr:hypothetical protein [Paraburkholderia caribensis]